jgi:hypothetical protein
MSTDFSGALTTQTMNLKSLDNLDGDVGITQTLLQTAQAAGVDVYPFVGNEPMLLTSGTNGFFDEIYHELWFKLAIQVAGFNYLRQVGTKVPQTEIGMNGLKDAYIQVCELAVTNGFIAPGAWTSGETIGNRADMIRNIADVGYYVYSLPISKQLPADRAARIAPLIQIAIKSAGAIHSNDVIVNVNK